MVLSTALQPSAITAVATEPFRRSKRVIGSCRRELSKATMAKPRADQAVSSTRRSKEPRKMARLILLESIFSKLPTVGSTSKYTKSCKIVGLGGRASKLWL